MSKIFVPKETVSDETRVAAVPETVKKLVKMGFEVSVQSGGGAASNVTDEDYRVHGSGLNGPGRNLIIALETHF